MSRVNNIIFIFFLFIYSSHSANILFFHGVASYSHRVVTYPLADALEKRGHSITYISPFQNRGPYINPNISEIVPSKLSKLIEDFIKADFEFNFRVQKLMKRNVFTFFDTGIDACEVLLSSKEFIEYLNKTEKIDLVVIDGAVPECAMVIVQRYGAKFINFDTVVVMGSEHDALGLAPESSSIPELELDPPQTPMSFLERVFNSLISIHYRWEHWKYVHVIDKMLRDFIKTKMDPKYEEDMPFVDDLARNASLVLYTGDIVTDYPRSHPPMMVNVGGLHCSNKSGKDLPTEIKNFLEQDVNDGFIYISLGSVMNSSNLPLEVRQVFFDSMEAFPKLKFLWKWNGPFPKEVPKNLYLGKWFPQVDLLSHEKIRGFVSQTGRPSMLESLYKGVPMISFPVLGDQDVNANRLNRMGGNVVLELGTVTREELKMAFRKVAYDKGMKERVLDLQRILFEQPMHPLDKAVWWTEYVLRHKDTSHLRSASFDQHWFQRRNIDVWFFLFAVMLGLLLGVIGVTILFCKVGLKMLSGSDASSKDKFTEVNNNLNDNKKHN